MRRRNNGFRKFMIRLDPDRELPHVRTRYDVKVLSNVRRVYPEFIRRVLQGNIRELSCSFTWSTSPQGFNHWEDRRDGREDMSEEDYEFLRQLLEVHQ